MANAIFMVAKFDRLSAMWPLRGVMRSAGIRLCDRPEADIPVHILAVIAEQEANKISERTTKALAALKARGVGSVRSSPAIGWESEQLGLEGGGGRRRLRPREAAGRSYYEDVDSIMRHRDTG